MTATSTLLAPLLTPLLALLLVGETVDVNVIGLLLKMTPAKRRAISVEVGMQNSGLASSLATLHFAAFPMATVPGAIFSVWHNISGAVVARFFARRKMC